MAKLDVESHLPITKEFIESFGFKQKYTATGMRSYTKGLIDEYKWLMLTVENDTSFSLVEVFGEKQETIFSDYTCTTQSELRFLLTKGRIDCSKN